MEIGVNTPAQPGYSHNSIKVKLKHGVDPNVDTTFKMESDIFFNTYINQKYDIIFVDGLHLYEQAYRDIINSLNYLNEGGTIVVHDCNPIREITQRRERASNAWHGDVWKAILKLRIENPNIILYTIDADEGCTIIQKGKQELFQTKEINIYTWDFFNKNRKNILNLISVRQFRGIVGMYTFSDKIIKLISK
ncbi:MAG: class I SAM-dependent methyltransferase [Chitinophagaceae bacterium]|nr:class I SAM-dependent methyltransferase [Chitinophagaceae bacterium]